MYEVLYTYSYDNGRLFESASIYPLLPTVGPARGFAAAADVPPRRGPRASWGGPRRVHFSTYEAAAAWCQLTVGYASGIQCDDSQEALAQEFALYIAGAAS